jgi:hypothetical protein
MGALTAATVINLARDKHPALSSTNAPNELAFRFLSSMQRDLVQLIARRVPGEVALRATIAFPLASFDAGVDLAVLIPGGWIDLTDLFVYYAQSPDTSRNIRSQFIPWEQRDTGRSMPAHTYRNNTLLFLGQASDYTAYVSAALTYSPLPTDITTPASLFTTSDDAREAYAAATAAFWLGRMLGSDPRVTLQVVQLFDQRASSAMDSYLKRILLTAQRQDYRVRDVR